MNALSFDQQTTFAGAPQLIVDAGVAAPTEAADASTTMKSPVLAKRNLGRIALVSVGMQGVENACPAADPAEYFAAVICAAYTGMLY